MDKKGPFETATLAGGCFWCIEAVFNEVEGVEKAVSGYAGGTVETPSYDQVCAGRTGHAEVVQITFDSTKISYREILEIFFSIHDPTTLDRQGADVGTQYRSAIFYHNEEQRKLAEEMIAGLDQEHIWKNKIVTQIAPLGIFYPAEDYHQNYFVQHPERAYCQMVISPKVGKFRIKWKNRLKHQPE